jgi:branched-chain amino acid transport system substrate-binding protein
MHHFAITRRRALFAAALFVSTAALAINSSVSWGQEPIKIGIVLPLGGANGDYVKRYLIAPTELAAKEVNAAGGLLGRQVKIITEDSRYDPASAVSALRKLADVDKVLAVFTGFTPLTLPQLPIAEEKKIIILAPSTEHPDLTKSKWAVRLTPTADKAGIRIARAAIKQQLKTAAIIAEDNEAIRLTQRAFQSEFEKLGGKVVLAETFKTQDTDMRGQLTKIRGARPEAVYIIVSSGRPLALILKQVSEVGLRPKRIFGNHLAEDREVKALGGAMVEGMVYTSLLVDPVFAQRFRAAYGYDADANVGKHYDATRLLFEAIKRAGSDDPVKVRDAIYSFGEFKGVLGPVKFQGSGEPEMYPMLKTVKGGNYVTFE